MTPTGLFVGLATVDAVLRVQAPPGPDEKITALRQDIAPGGPATGAAVAFVALGGRATLVTALGRHVLASYVAEDLRGHGVDVVDAAPERTEPPTVSTILVTDATGERSVASVNARGVDPTPPADVAALIAQADVVLLDGHHPALALAAAQAADRVATTVVLDSGSWKPVLDKLVPHITAAVCSSTFRVPGTTDVEQSAAALLLSGVPLVAVTAGQQPIRWWAVDQRGAVAVPSIVAKDTLGAGDAFHGAFAYGIAGLPRAALTDPGTVEAVLSSSAEVAAVRCSSTGPREWLRDGALPGLGRRLRTVR